MLLLLYIWFLGFKHFQGRWDYHINLYLQNQSRHKHSMQHQIQFQTWRNIWIEQYHPIRIQGHSILYIQSHCYFQLVSWLGGYRNRQHWYRRIILFSRRQYCMMIEQWWPQFKYKHRSNCYSSGRSYLQCNRWLRKDHSHHRWSQVMV